MAELQNDFTTPEQSKRLLKFGVPPQSANFYWGLDGKIHYIDGSIPHSLLFRVGVLPCWSGMRLIDILEKSWDSNAQIICDPIGHDDKISYMIDTLQYFAAHSMADFSKLKLKN